MIDWLIGALMPTLAILQLYRGTLHFLILHTLTWNSLEQWWSNGLTNTSIQSKKVVIKIHNESNGLQYMLSYHFHTWNIAKTLCDIKQLLKNARKLLHFAFQPSKDNSLPDSHSSVNPVIIVKMISKFILNTCSMCLIFFTKYM